MSTKADQLQSVSESREEHGLNKCLKAINLTKITFYYRKNEYQHEHPEDERLKEEIIDIIAEHPKYGWRRILPDLREAAGEPVDHKRLKRLPREYDLGLARQVQENKPSPLGEIVRKAGRKYQRTTTGNRGADDVLQYESAPLLDAKHSAGSLSCTIAKSRRYGLLP